MKKAATGFILLALVCLNLIAPQQADAETCPIYDANKIFDDGSYYKAIWASGNLTWGFDPNELPNIGEVWGQTGARISRKPTASEKLIIEGAFQNWDRALDKLSIQFTASPNPDIKVGFIEANNHPWFFRYYPISTERPKGQLLNGVIGFNSLDTGIVNEGYFSALAHRIVANVLGMGLISNSNSNTTVMKGDLQEIYDAHSGGSLKNEGSRYVPTEYEIGLIRSLYGESTCPTTFGKSLIKQEKIKRRNKQN
jgi:hypothetical protein